MGERNHEWFRGIIQNLKTEQVDDWLYISEYMFIKSFGQEMPEIISVDIHDIKTRCETKKNEDNVPLEILRQKHRMAYNNLRQELKDMTEAIIHEVVHRNPYIKWSDAEHSLQKNQPGCSGFGMCELISKALYQEKCYGSVIAGIMKLRKLVLEAAEEERTKVPRGKEKKQLKTQGLYLAASGTGDKRGSCVYQDKAADGAPHSFRMHAGGKERTG